MQMGNVSNHIALTLLSGTNTGLGLKIQVVILAHPLVC